MSDEWKQTGRFLYDGRVAGMIYTRASYSIVRTHEETQIGKHYRYALWHGKTTPTTMASLIGTYGTAKGAKKAAENHEQSNRNASKARRL